VSSSVIFSWLSLSLFLQGLLLATGGFSIRFPEIARLGTEEVVSKGVSAVSGVFGSRFELLALLRSGVGFFLELLFCLPLLRSAWFYLLRLLFISRVIEKILLFSPSTSRTRESSASQRTT
jgi:hypothetical protein